VIHSLLRAGFIALSRSRTMGRVAVGSGLAWRAARRFIAGQTIDEAIRVVGALNDAELRVTLDHLGENVATRAEAERSADAYVEALERIRAAGVYSGVSLKLTALGLDLSLGDVVAEALLRRVLERAGAFDPPVFVRIDMEGSPYTQRTLDLFRRVRADHGHVGIVIQSYLRRSDADIAALVAEGAPVRLVKGAYLEPEAIAYPDKADVDAAYLRQAEALLSPEARARGVYAALATHDEAIIDWAKAHAARVGLGKDDFEFQMLYGIRRDLQLALVAEGYRMRVYVPYGREWFPYFMRRLAERPENLAFVLRGILAERRGT